MEERKLELKIVKKPFTTNDGKEIEYINIYLVFDGYIYIKLEKGDSLKYLTKFLKSGGTISMLGNSYKLSK